MHYWRGILLLMSNDDGSSYGPNLYAYLESYWRAHGTNQNAWCDAHPGIQAPTVSRWRTGTEPRLAAFRAVADALGYPVLDVLVAAGVITEAEAGGHTATVATSPTVDVALKVDQSLTSAQRGILRDMLSAMRDVSAGNAETVTRVPAKQARRRRA